MDFLGSFGPTVNSADRTLKGWVPDADGEVRSAYISATELREMATHFHEVADWLDDRAREEIVRTILAEDEAARPAQAGTNEADDASL